jgi:hypothetical protein
MPLAPDVQLEWARRGALARLHELDQERSAILKSFPGLDRHGVSSAVPGKSAAAPKRVVSAAARRKITAGARRYWREWRAAKRAAGKGKAKPKSQATQQA